MPKLIDLTWLDNPPPYDSTELSDEARHGLDIAQRIYQRKPEERGDAIRDLAGRYHTSTVRRWIHKARRELTRSRTECEIPDCENRLPTGSRSNRRYCDEHATPAARVRRHRDKPHQQPRPTHATTRLDERANRQKRQ